jgi:surface polysaccharide O-acyltransferase-like enzyme
MGGAGDWPVKDTAVDRISPIWLAIFNAVNQAYFMSAFFLLAGYFTPRTLVNKGIKHFLGDRLVRLGIPLVIYSTLIVNINQYLLNVYYRGLPYQPLVGYNAGHLWFLQALLVFAGVYAGVRALTAHRVITAPAPKPFPSDRTWLGWIGLLTVLTFAVRLVFPVGVWVLEMQLGHFVHYLFAFAAGILAYHQDWFHCVPADRARRWGWQALAAIPLFVILVVLTGALEDGANVNKLLGGWRWEALAFALWESWLLIGMTLWLLSLFQTKFNVANSWIRSIAANVYTVYIIHQTILIALNIALLSAPIPTIVKFALTSLLTIFVAFVLSSLLRRFPMVRYVVG